MLPVFAAIALPSSAVADDAVLGFAAASDGDCGARNARGANTGRSSVSAGASVNELADAAWPRPSSTCPTGLATTTRPSVTVTRKPARGPGLQRGSQTVTSAR